MIEFALLELFNDWDRIAEGIEERAEAHVEATLEHIQQHVATAMELPKSGKTYGSHVASEAGDAPAIDTADLIDSAVVQQDGTEGVIVYTSDHALHMEYGAPNASVAARPFLAPSVEAERPAFDAGLEGLIQP